MCRCKNLNIKTYKLYEAQSIPHRLISSLFYFKTCFLWKGSGFPNAQPHHSSG